MLHRLCSPNSCPPGDKASSCPRSLPSLRTPCGKESLRIKVHKTTKPEYIMEELKCTRSVTRMPLASWREWGPGCGYPREPVKFHGPRMGGGSAALWLGTVLSGLGDEERPCVTPGSLPPTRCSGVCVGPIHLSRAEPCVHVESLTRVPRHPGTTTCFKRLGRHRAQGHWLSPWPRAPDRVALDHRGLVLASMRVF